MPLVDRLARFGYSERDCATVSELLTALDDMRSGRPMSAPALAILSRREAAKRSGDQQLSAIVAAQSRRA